MDADTKHNGSARLAVHVVDRTKPGARRTKRAGRKATPTPPTRLVANVLGRVEKRAIAHARGVGGWIKANPWTAAGAVLGVGVLLGIGARTRLGRTALLGLSGLATVAAKRYL